MICIHVEKHPRPWLAGLVCVWTLGTLCSHVEPLCGMCGHAPAFQVGESETEDLLKKPRTLLPVQPWLCILSSLISRCYTGLLAPSPWLVRISKAIKGALTTSSGGYRHGYAPCCITCSHDADFCLKVYKWDFKICSTHPEATIKLSFCVFF